MWLAILHAAVGSQNQAQKRTFLQPVEELKTISIPFDFCGKQEILPVLSETICKRVTKASRASSILFFKIYSSSLMNTKQEQKHCLHTKINETSPRTSRRTIWEQQLRIRHFKRLSTFDSSSTEVYKISELSST